MAKRERLEDLGRIFQLVVEVLDMELFNIIEGRNKDFLDKWSEMTPEQQEDFLYKLPYQISSVNDKLHDIWAISQGDEE
jgi:hypothetical protein